MLREVAIALTYLRNDILIFLLFKQTSTCANCATPQYLDRCGIALEQKRAIARKAGASLHLLMDSRLTRMAQDTAGARRYSVSVSFIFLLHWSFQMWLLGGSPSPWA